MVVFNQYWSAIDRERLCPLALGNNNGKGSSFSLRETPQYCAGNRTLFPGTINRDC